MALDIFTDNSFTIPTDVRSAPCCPVCEAALIVDVYERDEDTSLPTNPGFHVWCSAQGEMGELNAHRDWDYDELLTAMAVAHGWFEDECRRRRSWEMCVWGESNIPEVA